MDFFLLSIADTINSVLHTFFNDSSPFDGVYIVFTINTLSETGIQSLSYMLAIRLNF